MYIIKIAKLFNYRIMFKDITTNLGLDNIDASLEIMYLVVLGIIFKKSDEKINYIKQNLLSKY